MLYRDYRRLDNNYIISNYGEIFSLRGKEPRELKSHDSGYGYLKLRVGERYDYVHAFVGEAFIGKRTGTLTYDHIDRNRKNNRADNIRLATTYEQACNKNKRFDNTSGETGIYHKDKSWVIDICRNGERYSERFLKENYSLQEVAKIREMIIADYNKNKNGTT